MGAKQILEIIEDYAKTYTAFEEIQKREGQNILPKYGDQKTGLIGEFYAKLYILNKDYKDVEYAASGAPFDISYTNKNSKTVKVQVKTANTGFSKTNTLSPIKKGWDFLYLISLDKNFKPIGFWIQEYREDMFKGKDRIPSAKY